MTIYFVCAETTGRVKIGFTRGDVSFRLAALRTGSPERLACIGTMPGDETTEKRIHSRFAPLRLHGEWFRGDADLLTFISENTVAPEHTGPWTPRTGLLYSGVLRNGITPATGRYLHSNEDGTLARIACVGGGEHWVTIDSLREHSE